MASSDDKRRLYRITFWCLLAAAILVLVLPLPLPLPLRLAVGGTDLIAAAVVWLALRQQGRA